MKIPDIDPETLRAATGGELRAIDRLLVTLQPGVFNLALRMLGQREDAGDATQEILLKVVTHLAGFRGESRFSTWVYQIARNHLLSAATRARESPEVSLEGIEQRLGAGLAFRDALGLAAGAAPMLTPEDKLAARQVALGCTQGMLMALDREQRLAYLLDAVFGLSSEQAAAVLGIAPAAYRKRLQRARQALELLAAASTSCRPCSTWPRRSRSQPPSQCRCCARSCWRPKRISMRCGAWPMRRPCSAPTRSTARRRRWWPPSARCCAARAMRVQARRLCSDLGPGEAASK
jgi:RNA polymerase sigma factor (sigma-70 family)